MSNLNYAPAQPDYHEVTNEKPASVVDDRTPRQRRIDALKRVAGIWADRKDIPADGLDYERELRAEWR